MHKLLSTLFLVLASFICQAQTNLSNDLEAHFSALIVTNIDSSIYWYSNSLGLKLINRVESKERGFKQANLKNENVLIELIELDNSLNVKDIVPNYSSKTRIIGLFKIGFVVKDFDKWINFLTNKKVKFYGNIVTDNLTGKRMVIITDPDDNRIQLFEK